MENETREVGEYSFDAWTLGQVQNTPEVVEDTPKPVDEVITPTPEVTKEVTPEIVAEDTPIQEDIDDSNFSTSAIILKAYIDDGFAFDPKDIDPKMTGKELLEILRDKTKEEVRPELESEYAQQGYNEQFKRDIEFLRNGGSIEELKQSFENQSYATLNIDDDEDETNREILIKAFYRDKGLSDEKAEQLYNLSKEGGESYVEAVTAQAYFFDKDKELIESQRAQAESQRLAEQKQYEDNQKTVDDILKTKVLGGIEITDREAKDIKKALYEPTETYEYLDDHGKKRQGKMTKYQALLQEYNNNAEWQLTFTKLLLDGFKFNKIANKVVKTRDNQINDVLGAKLSNSVSKEKAISKNNNYNLFGTNNESKLVGEHIIK